MNKALLFVGLLLAVNVWVYVTRDVGPDPELEALHSEEAAVDVCREALVSRLAARSPSIVGPGRPEYLQGGEYEVRFRIEFQAGARRNETEALCQLQFTTETGWIVEDVTLD